MKSRVPKNIGGAQNMNSMIKQAQKMQDEITELQNDIEAREFSGNLRRRTGRGSGNRCKKYQIAYYQAGGS